MALELMSEEGKAEADALLSAAVKMVCNVHVGTVQNPEGEEAGYIMFSHPLLALPLCSVLPRSVVEHIIAALTMMLPHVTFEPEGQQSAILSSEEVNGTAH